MKEKVELYIDAERRLFIKTESGKEFELFIFNGGGYVTQLWPRTQKEIEESNRKFKEAEQKYIKEKQPVKKKKWFGLI